MFGKSNTPSSAFAVKVNAIKSNMPEAKEAFQVIEEMAYRQSTRPVSIFSLFSKVDKTKKPKEQVEKSLRDYADKFGVEVK